MKYVFQNKEDYLKQREALLAEAEKMLNSGDVEGGEKKMKAVEEMDNGFEDFAKIQANLKALNENVAKSNPLDYSGKARPEAEDIHNSKEYRMAFMNYVIGKKEMPAQFQNQDANTKTTDIGTVIPTTVVERIIQKIESVGMILPLVTRTGYKGGVTIPTSAVKPTATWVNEGAGSDKQKKTTGSVTFAYHKLRCAISVSLETDTMALSVFETTFVNEVSEAMVKALEQSIISGSGSGQPKGILAETAPSGQAIEITEGNSITYSDLINAEAALPQAYENGAVWFMTKKTFMSIIGMVDDAGQPIARVNYGIGGRPERTLLGRSVILNEYMSNFATTVTADTTVAFMFNPKDYILNTNLNVTVKKYEDNDTDDIITKAVMLVDGKVVDKNSLVTVTVKNS